MRRAWQVGLVAVASVAAGVAPAAAVSGGFGADGIKLVARPTGVLVESVSSMRIDGHGRIVTVGGGAWHIDNGNALRARLVVRRFLASGVPDRSFNATGMNAIAPRGYSLAPAGGTQQLTIQANGRLLAVGNLGALKGSKLKVAPIAMVRFLRSGKRDKSFGTDGIARLDFPLPYRGGVATAVAVAPHGKILVSASVGGNTVGVARLLASGALDHSFSGDGYAELTALSQPAIPTAIRATSDGRIEVAASADGAFAIARLRAAGGLDPTFGTGGVVQTLHGVDATPVAMMAQPNGSLVLAGTDLAIANGGITLIRYTPRGALDGSFGTGGIEQPVIPGAPTDEVSDAALLPSGRIVVAAKTHEGSVVVVRFLATGQPDGAYGAHGRRTIKFHGLKIGPGPIRRLDATHLVLAAGSFQDVQLARITN